MNNEIHTCNNDCQRPACVAVREAVAAERERCAKLCYDKAWELKERSIKETVKTQRARLGSEAAAWHDAFTAIRARGNN